MLWADAQILAKSGLHVRRESWPEGHWLIYHRGIAWYWDGAKWNVVAAHNFAMAEWSADDWTAIPQALAQCPDIPLPEDTTGSGGDRDNGDDPDADDDADASIDLDPLNPRLPPVFSDSQYWAGGAGGGGGGGVTPAPKPRPPKPSPSTCRPPTITVDAYMFCDDEKKLIIEIWMTGGSGTWSLKCLVPKHGVESFGFVDPASGHHSRQFAYDCDDGDSFPIVAIATGWRECAPMVVSQRVEVACECDPGCFDNQTYYESHGWDECPSAASCPGGGTASCAGMTIRKTLRSKPFAYSCMHGKLPKADVWAGFDDYGSIGGLGCNETENCNSCGVGGTVTPRVVGVGGGKFVMEVDALAVNAWWGGPYSLNCSAYFYFA